VKPTGREPDPSFDRFLAHGLARTVDASGNACPDADLLAAWFDHTLSPVESERIEAHVSGCECCQQILAALARSEPEVIRAAPLPAPARAWHWHWRWVVPLATAVLVVVVGTRTLISPGPVAVVGTPPQQAKASVAEETRAADVNLAAAKTEAPAAELATPAPALSSQAPAGRAVPAPPPSPPVQAEAAPTAGAPQLAAKPEQQVAAMARQQADAVGGQAQMKAPAPKAVATADAESLARVARPTINAVGARQAPLNMPVVAGPTVAWRFGRDGSIEKSSDRGLTWESQSSGVTTALTDASAASDTVCWIVGARGVVLRTTDGRTWRRLASPTETDLVAVHAWSDLSATVTAADHTVYETADGGKSWRRR
jgi:hypothetical protein